VIARSGPGCILVNGDVCLDFRIRFARRTTALKDAQADCNRSNQKLNRVFAHEIRRMRPERRTDCGNADDHRQNKTRFQNFGIRLPAHHATEPINDVHNANAGDRELERSEKRGELYQPNRPQIEKPPDRENKLRAPDVFEAIRWRRKDSQSVITPGQSELECNCDNTGNRNIGDFSHGSLLT
jgi:hypothetical protein